MQYLVLLGAGFSRNWGGWLASEAFEYMLGIRDLDARTKNVLWKYKDRGGFEDALAALQDELAKRNTADATKRLEKMQMAISQMFQDMDQAFADIEFEQQQFRGYTVARFLTRFDAIFTLNQDTLLERRYIENVPFLSEGRWTGYQFPGMARHPGQNPIHDKIGTWSPASEGEVQLDKNLQPLIKLHGSWNWTTGGGHPLLIMGGNKAREISQHSILSWNFDRFREFLGRTETRLMVIGYSFRDPHVNQIIFDAVDRSGLELFIIDPLGVDVLNENRNPVALITAESQQFRQLNGIKCRSWLMNQKSNLSSQSVNVLHHSGGRMSISGMPHSHFSAEVKSNPTTAMAVASFLFISNHDSATCGRKAPSHWS